MNLKETLDKIGQKILDTCLKVVPKMEKLNGTLQCLLAGLMASMVAVLALLLISVWFVLLFTTNAALFLMFSAVVIGTALIHHFYPDDWSYYFTNEEIEEPLEIDDEWGVDDYMSRRFSNKKKNK
jgi:hypothetical protein